MVPSLKLSIVANGNHPIGVGLAAGSTIHFGNLEFTADHLGCLNFSPQEWDSSVVFIGMLHNGSLSLHIALEESFDEDDAISGVGGALDPLAPKGGMW
jgi:hypothetical protein